MLFFESFKKIRFLVGNADIAVANSVIATEGGAAGWDRTGGGGELWAGHRPISFPVMCSPSRTCEPCCRSGSGRNTGRRCGRSWLPQGWANGGGPICRQPYGEGDLRAFRREECCHGPAVAAAAAAEAASSGVWDIHSDVAQQFAQEEGDLRLLQRRRLQGGQVVPQDGRPVFAAAYRIIQPLAGSLFVTKAVGSQE